MSRRVVATQPRRTPVKRGSLTVVGTGIQVARDLTPGSSFAIQRADKVLHLVTDFITAAVIKRLNPTAEPLNHHYKPGRVRARIYADIVEDVLSHVRRGENVCMVTYGHPGVFVDATAEAIARARASGFAAAMLPGVSSEDCMFADTGVDPARNGCLTFEATSFLLGRPTFESTIALVLYQIGVVGDLTHRKKYGGDGLTILARELIRRYGPQHIVTVYDAAASPFTVPSIQRVALRDLARASVDVTSTLYVPPLGLRTTDARMLRRLGLERFAPGRSGSTRRRGKAKVPPRG